VRATKAVRGCLPIATAERLHIQSTRCWCDPLLRGGTDWHANADGSEPVYEPSDGDDITAAGVPLADHR
jgi:hypothetical protein